MIHCNKYAVNVAQAQDALEGHGKVEARVQTSQIVSFRMPASESGTSLCTRGSG